MRIILIFLHCMSTLAVLAVRMLKVFHHFLLLRLPSESSSVYSVCCYTLVCLVSLLYVLQYEILGNHLFLPPLTRDEK